MWVHTASHVPHHYEIVIINTESGNVGVVGKQALHMPRTRIAMLRVNLCVPWHLTADTDAPVDLIMHKVDSFSIKGHCRMVPLNPPLVHLWYVTGCQSHHFNDIVHAVFAVSGVTLKLLLQCWSQGKHT